MNMMCIISIFFSQSEWGTIEPSYIKTSLSVFFHCLSNFLSTFTIFLLKILLTFSFRYSICIAYEVDRIATKGNQPCHSIDRGRCDQSSMSRKKRKNHTKFPEHQWVDITHHLYKNHHTVESLLFVGVQYRN